MTNENKNIKKEKIENKKDESKDEIKKSHESKPVDKEKKVIENSEKKQNDAGDEKPVVKKESKKKMLVKKEEAIANGVNLRVGKRHGIYICSFIKNKKIDAAIKDLEEVIKLKKAIPFKGEIPHRKGKIMSGRYPVKGAKLFIPLLKGLRGNVLANGLDLDKTVIYYASANGGFMPAKRKGGKTKRTHVLLKAKELGAKVK